MVVARQRTVCSSGRFSLVISVEHGGDTEHRSGARLGHGVNLGINPGVVGDGTDGGAIGNEYPLPCCSLIVSTTKE